MCVNAGKFCHHAKAPFLHPSPCALGFLPQPHSSFTITLVPAAKAEGRGLRRWLPQLLQWPDSSQIMYAVKQENGILGFFKRYAIRLLQLAEPWHILLSEHLIPQLHFFMHVTSVWKMYGEKDSIIWLCTDT